MECKPLFVLLKGENILPCLQRFLKSERQQTTAQRTQYKPGATIWMCLEISRAEGRMSCCAGGCGAYVSSTKQPRIPFNHSPTQVSAPDPHRGPLHHSMCCSYLWSGQEKNTEPEIRNQKGIHINRKDLDLLTWLFQSGEERETGEIIHWITKQGFFFFKIVSMPFLLLCFYYTELAVHRIRFCFKAFLYYYLTHNVCTPSRGAI